MDTNSTNVRSTREAPWFFRTMIRAGAAVLPEVTEQYAAKLFVTPSLRKGKTPRELHAELLPERAMQRRSGEKEPAFPVLPSGRIALWSWGRGPTVLLVHGWSGHAGDMAPLAAEFVRAGYRAVLFDMPGHGGSSPSPTNLFIYLRTIAAVAPLIGPIDTVVGHSLGGTATALALGQGLVKAKRAALLAPAVSPWAFSWHFAQMIGLPAERVPGMVRRTEELVGANADSLNAAAAVSGLEIPGHIVHDPADLDVPFEHSAKLTAAWRNAELTARPGLGHRRILRDAETMRGIIDFARAERPARAAAPTPMALDAAAR